MADRHVVINFNYGSSQIYYSLATELCVQVVNCDQRQSRERKRERGRLLMRAQQNQNQSRRRWQSIADALTPFDGHNCSVCASAGHLQDTHNSVAAR